MTELPPEAVEAEQTLLGMCLDRPELLADIDWLPTEDFWVERHQWIIGAMRDLRQRGLSPDYISILNELRERNRLEELGGNEYLAELMRSIPSWANSSPEAVARTVQDAAIRRRLLLSSQEIARLAHAERTDVFEVVRRAGEVLKAVEDNIAHHGSEVRDISRVVTDLANRADYWRQNPASIRGVASGLAPLDEMFGGFEKRELTILAARPGMGKSGMVARVARGAASTGATVLIFSLEMTELSMIDRMACQIGMVDSRKLKQGALAPDEYRRYDAALVTLAVYPIRIVAKGMLALDDIMAITKSEQRARPVDLVMIDTLNKIPEAGDSLYQQMSRLTNRLSGWALNSDFHVIVAAQLSRANSQRSDKMPQLSDLRDSGTVEQDADNVVFLHRDYYYDQSDLSKRNEARFIIAKRREGKVGSDKLWWVPESTNFEAARIDKVELDSVIVHGRE